MIQEAELYVSIQRRAFKDLCHRIRKQELVGEAAAQMLEEAAVIVKLRLRQTTKPEELRTTVLRMRGKMNTENTAVDEEEVDPELGDLIQADQRSPTIDDHVFEQEEDGRIPMCLMARDIPEEESQANPEGSMPTPRFDSTPRESPKGENDRDGVIQSMLGSALAGLPAEGQPVVSAGDDAHQEAAPASHDRPAQDAAGHAPSPKAEKYTSHGSSASHDRPVHDAAGSAPSSPCKLEKYPSQGSSARPSEDLLASLQDVSEPPSPLLPQPPHGRPRGDRPRRGGSVSTTACSTPKGCMTPTRTMTPKGCMTPVSFEPQELQEADMPSVSETAKRLAARGFTVRQLLIFCQKHLRNGRLTQDTTTRNVVNRIVLPQTEARMCSYMEGEFMKELGGGHRAAKFVSHSWNAKFWTTVLNILLDACGSHELLCERCCYGNQLDSLSCDIALERMSERALKRTYWLDVFAVNQHKSICGDCQVCRSTAGDWNAQMYAAQTCRMCNRPKPHPCRCGVPKIRAGEPPCETDKFGEVLTLMRSGLIVSLDPQLVALSRAWVVREVGLALTTKPVSVRMALGMENQKVQELRTGVPLVTPLRDCDIASLVDMDVVLQQIQDEGGCEMFDLLVSCMVELSFGRCTRLAGVTGRTREALRNVRHLDMNFGWCCKSLIDLSSLGFGEGLLSRLEGLSTLILDFTDCKQLRNLKPLCLEFKLGLSGLTQCYLDFRNTGISEVVGIGSSVKGLKNLQKLRADFSKCWALKDLSGLEGLSSLAELCDCSMNFSGNGMTQVAALTSGLGGLAKLQRLSLDLSLCKSLADVSGLEWCLASLTSLQECSLDLSGTRVDDVAAVGAGLGGLQELETLSVSFRDCSSIKSVGGLQGLAGLTALKECTLDFQSTSISDVMALGAGLVELRGLQRLRMNFAGCTRLRDITGLNGLVGLEELAECTLDLSGTGTSDIAPLAAGLEGPKELERLMVDLRGCSALADVSALRCLSILAELKECALGFSGTQVSDLTALGGALGSLKNLEKLSMGLKSCKALTRLSGLEALSGLTSLRDCRLALGGTSISDVAALGAGLRGLWELRRLSLSFSGCGALTDFSGLEGLASLTALAECDLDFQETNLSDLGPLGVGLVGLQSVQRLHLDFFACRGLTDLSCLEALANSQTLRKVELRILCTLVMQTSKDRVLQAFSKSRIHFSWFQ